MWLILYAKKAIKYNHLLLFTFQHRMNHRKHPLPTFFKLRSRGITLRKRGSKPARNRQDLPPFPPNPGDYHAKTGRKPCVFAMPLPGLRPCSRGAAVLPLSGEFRGRAFILESSRLWVATGHPNVPIYTETRIFLGGTLSGVPLGRCRGSLVL